MAKRSRASSTNGAKANGHAAAVILGGTTARQPDLDTAKLLEELQVPFDPALIRWRAHEFKVIQGRRFGLFFPHADPRAYKDRLNLFFGPMAWCDSYEITTIPTKILVVCQLTINPLGPHAHSATGEEWSRDENATTSAEAQAFKRACASFGLGRYLYYFSGVWLELDSEKKPLSAPALPLWATPEGWRQGVRPDPVIALPAEPVVEMVNGAGNSFSVRTNGCKNVIPQLLQMETKLGAGLYRGLLKALAEVWGPTEIREIALQQKVLRHMEGAIRGLERLRTASEKLGQDSVARILVSFDLASTADIKDMDTLYRVVLAVEEAANSKS